MEKRMLYAEFLVKKVGVVHNKPPAAPISYFKCEMEDREGKHVCFSLPIEGREGNPQNAKLAAVRPHFKEGRLLYCLIVYYDRGNSFNMAIAEFGRMQAYTLNWNKITPEEYFDPRRRYWVTTKVAGPWICMPGPLELYGETNIPILNDERRKLLHVPYNYSYAEGLQWTRRRRATSFFRSFFG